MLRKILCEMGHGDEIVLADANFPAESIAHNNQIIRADGIGVFGPHTTDAGKIAHHGKQGDETVGVGQYRHHGGRGAETRHHKGGQQGFFLFGQGQHQTEQKAHGILRHARVGGGIAVQPQKEVMQDEQSAGADLHDAQPLGRLELKGKNDESHGAKAPDLTQNKERSHNGLLVGRIGFHYSTEIRIFKGKITENFSVALTDGKECDTIWSRSDFDRL